MPDRSPGVSTGSPHPHAAAIEAAIVAARRGLDLTSDEAAEALGANAGPPRRWRAGGTAASPIVPAPPDRPVGVRA